MTAYKAIYDEAIGNYGIITVAQAKKLGITNETLVKLASRGRLERIAHGVVFSSAKWEGFKSFWEKKVF